ncbi:MAG: tRNA (adenosine(37)-N6)-threonylcarbamoyltransferase complex ATPase subunit type 1 TsaE [Telmatospirillum sp.]|nr:tRNA (adenosine(37)-N6)-threonylcarbamoyltransferase complex ATPase subunit type 1 TsaE [Telmatospirillum sp.]
MVSPPPLPRPPHTATDRGGGARARRARPGDVFALEGDLGTGKTALARAFVRALAGPDEDVPSPTFTLVQLYDADPGTIWHFDLYRLEKPEDALELGVEDAFAEGISLIEWPDRLGPWLPRDRLTVALSAGDADGSRHAVLTGGPDWARRLQTLGESLS